MRQGDVTGELLQTTPIGGATGSMGLAPSGLSSAPKPSAAYGRGTSGLQKGTNPVATTQWALLTDGRSLSPRLDRSPTCGERYLVARLLEWSGRPNGRTSPTTEPTTIRSRPDHLSHPTRISTSATFWQASSNGGLVGSVGSEATRSPVWTTTRKLGSAPRHQADRLEARRTRPQGHNWPFSASAGNRQHPGRRKAVSTSAAVTTLSGVSGVAAVGRFAGRKSAGSCDPKPQPRGQFSKRRSDRQNRHPTRRSNSVVLVRRPRWSSWPQRTRLVRRRTRTISAAMPTPGEATALPRPRQSAPAIPRIRPATGATSR